MSQDIKDTKAVYGTANTTVDKQVEARIRQQKLDGTYTPHHNRNYWADMQSFNKK